MSTASRIGEQTSGLLAELTAVAEDARLLMSVLVDEDVGPGAPDAVDLEATLASLDQGVQFALVKTNGVARLLADSEQSSPLLARMEVLQDVLGALLAVERSAMVGLRAMEPAIAGDGLLESEGGLVEVLNAIAEDDHEIREAVALLADAQKTLRDLNAGAGASEDFQGLSDLEEAAALIGEGLQLALDVAPLGAELLAANSTRRYLVLGQSADELRATGGFVSAAWLVSFENGGLADIRYHDIVLVDDSQRFILYPPAPPALEEHMNARVWLLRDVSWEPDFPTAARTAEDM